MRSCWPVAVVLALAAGCQPFWRSPPRPAALELDAPQGHWRFEGVQRAVLELTGWQVRVLESQVAPYADGPLLEKLVLEVVNTSPVEPLVLRPGAVTITDVGDARLEIGPPQTVVLKQNESHRFVYNPGIRADVLPHPFLVNIAAFRGADLDSPVAATLELY